MNKLKAIGNTINISYEPDNQRIYTGMLRRLRLTPANITALANSRHISLFAIPDKRDARRFSLATELLNEHGYFILLTAQAKGTTIFLVTRPNDGICGPSADGNELMKISQSHELRNPALSPEQTAEIVNACFANKYVWFPMTLFRKLASTRGDAPFYTDPQVAEIIRGNGRTGSKKSKS